MTEWYLTIKRIKGRSYLYRQRTWREGGRVRSQSQYVGPVDLAGPVAAPSVQQRNRRKRSRFNEVAMAVFGVEDDCGERIDSLWNRHFNKQIRAEAKTELPQTKISAEDTKAVVSVLAEADSEVPAAGASESLSDLPTS